MNNEEKSLVIARSFVSPSTKHLTANKILMLQIEDACNRMAQWKDEQIKQLLVKKTKFLSSSAAQDSIKRCTIEEIYRELFNEEMPNSNPYMK